MYIFWKGASSSIFVVNFSPLITNHLFQNSKNSILPFSGCCWLFGAERTCQAFLWCQFQSAQIQSARPKEGEMPLLIKAVADGQGLNFNCYLKGRRELYVWCQFQLARVQCRSPIIPRNQRCHFPGCCSGFRAKFRPFSERAHWALPLMSISNPAQPKLREIKMPFFRVLLRDWGQVSTIFRRGAVSFTFGVNFTSLVSNVARP